MQYTQHAGGSQPGKAISHSGTCDLCGAQDCPDIFDAQLLIGGRRQWCWSCQTCFDTRIGRLGVGAGQHYTRSATK